MYYLFELYNNFHIYIFTVYNHSINLLRKNKIKVPARYGKTFEKNSI